jgi:hypothetical protein
VPANPFARVRLQTREFKQGAWSSTQTANFLGADGAELRWPSLPKIDFARAKGGDVLTVSYPGATTFNYFVAMRRSAEAAFAAIAPDVCIAARCGIESYDAPRLELDGTVTVYKTSGRNGDEWLAIAPSAAAPLTPLWKAGAASGVEYPIVRLLDKMSLPIWIARSPVGATGASLSVWQSGQRAPWIAEVQALKGCLLPTCAAISQPEVTHVATISRVTTNTAKLYVSDRNETGQWAQSMPDGGIDASMLQTGALEGAAMTLNSFRALGNTQIIVGIAEPLFIPTAAMPAPTVTLFAVAKK